MAVIASRRGDAAAELARARGRRRNRRRRIPLLPALVFTIVVTQIPFVLTIWYSLQSYNLYHPFTRHFTGLHNYTLIFTDAIFMITSGGPGQQTTNVPYYLYEVAFRSFDIGRASAMGVVVVVITIVVATFALRTISGLFSDEGMEGRL